MYRNFYDSPLIGFNSLNTGRYYINTPFYYINTRRYYVTLSDSKRTSDNLPIDPWFISGFTDGVSPTKSPFFLRLGSFYHTVAKRQYRTKAVQPIVAVTGKESTALVV